MSPVKQFGKSGPKIIAMPSLPVTGVRGEWETREYETFNDRPQLRAFRNMLRLTLSALAPPFLISGKVAKNPPLW